MNNQNQYNPNQSNSNQSNPNPRDQKDHNSKDAQRDPSARESQDKSEQGMNSSSKSKGNSSESWKQVRTKVRAKFGQLTEDEIDRSEGNLDGLTSLIQKKTGVERSQVDKDIRRICEECDYTFDKTFDKSADKVSSHEYKKAS